MPCCDILQVFDEKNNLIKDYTYWKLLIRNSNTTLGNCVAIANRHMERFSEITNDEMEEFAHVVKDVETALNKAFSYDKINYLMLMMKDKHVHFHIIPRYSALRKFAGFEWVDDFQPDPLMQRHPDVSKEVLQQVRNKIIENI